MNFLAIVQRLRRESGSTASGSSGPTTVVSQSGIFASLVDWASDAWMAIQRRSDSWKWMRSRFTLVTSSGDDEYAYGDATDVGTSSAITRFQRWIPMDEYGYSNLTMYPTAAGVASERYLSYLDWSAFRALFKRGPQSNNTPVYFTISPDNKILLGPKPDGSYTLQGEYQKSAQTLSADADTPEMPEDYHMLIVWEALKSYSTWAAAPEVWTRADEQGDPINTALHLNQSPAFVSGGALA